MGLLKFGLCVVTWIILCVSKTNAEYKSIENNGTRCVEGQEILQTDPCIKCMCVQGTTLCENVPCNRKRKNATRSGPDTKLLNEKVIPPDLSNRRRLPYHIPNKNDAILPNYQKPHMSSFYTKDSKVIEERRPNISMILTQTREENILNTFLPQSPHIGGNNAVNNDDNYILIVPDEESEMDENFQAQTGQSVSPTAFELPPGVPRPLARQPLVFGRPGDKRLLMRPRHFMRNDLKRGMDKYTQQKDFSSSNVNSNWKNKFNQQGSMSYPQNGNGNSGVSVYTPSQSAPFSQSEYYYPKEPIIYNDQKTNSKHFVDGKVRWKLAKDYPGDQMPQNNNVDQPEPMSDSESSADMPNNNRIWNQPPSVKYPSSEFPGGKYPVGKFPIGMYPGSKYPGGNYPSGNYPNGQYPGINFPDGKFPGGKYPDGKFPVGNYPEGIHTLGNYPGGKYPGGKIPNGKYLDGNYPDGKYPGGKYPDGNYPGGKYPGGKYPEGNYPDGKYPGGQHSNGNYPDGKYPSSTYPDGNYPGGKYPVGKYPGGNYPDGKYPGGKYPDGNYPDGKYPSGTYPDGNYPGGKYTVGKYPGGNYPDGKYPGLKYPDGNYPDGKYPGGKYPVGNYPNGKYPGGKYPGGNYPDGKYPSGSYPDGKHSDGNYPGGSYPGSKSQVGKYPDGKYPDGNYPGGSYPDGSNPGGGYPSGNIPSGSYPGGTYPGSTYPGGDNSGSNYPGGDNPDGSYPGGNNPGGSNFDQSNPLSSLENNNDLNESFPDVYPEKTETTTVKYTEYKWQKKQKRKKKKQKKLLALDETPFEMGNDYPPNESISQAFNKKKKIIKKKRKTKKKKQFMLYLDDDDDKKPTNSPTYDEYYTNPESDSPSYPDDDSPTGGNIPTNPDYGINPIKQLKRPKNNQLPGNLQPNQNPINNDMIPTNTLDYPNYPGQDKSIHYKKHKLHKKKPSGLYDEPELPIKIPNYMSPQNKFPRPQAPDQNLKPPISNYQPFQPRPLLSDDVFPNKKDKKYMLSTQKTPYSEFSGEISKKKRKRKKKKDKNFMLSALDTPDPDYPELSADLAKKIKNILLSTQKTPYHDYPKITPELVKQIKNILLTTQPTPSQDYSLITPELAKKLKHILLTTQKTPYPHPLLNKPPIQGIGFSQNPKRPNEPSLVVKPYKPQRPKVIDMYPDYEPGYPDMPKKPGNKNPFVPVSLDTKPQNYPDYDTNPMMYDYPHITEKPDEMKPIVPQVINNEPQMYQPQKPQNPVNYPDYGGVPNDKPVSDSPQIFFNEPEMYPDYEPKPKVKPKKPKNGQQMPLMYDEIKPKSVQTLNARPKLPVDESLVMPVINSNLPEKYPGYPSNQVSERPIVPLGIYPNKAQPKPNKYDNIPNIEAIESSIIPQTLDSELQMYPGYKPKPKRPLIDNKPKMYPDYEPVPIVPQYPTGPITEEPILPIALGDEPQMYPNYKPKPVANQYPGRPKKPSSPVTYDSRPDLYVDDTPAPFIKPQPYKPQRPVAENSIIPVSHGSEPQMYPDFNPKPQRPVAEIPIMPVSLGSEPQMYPDFNPKPQRPVAEIPIMPVSLGSEPQMYPDFNPKPQRPIAENPIMPVSLGSEPQTYPDFNPKPGTPFGENPIIPVNLGNEPQMYPDFNPKPKKHMSEKPGVPVIYDIEPEIYIDDTPEPLLNQSPPENPLSDSPLLPVTYDSEPQMYSDNEPTSMTVYKPRKPVNEEAIIPQTFDNKLQMYPDYKSAAQQPVDDMPPSPVNDIGPEVYIDDTPTPTNEYDQIPQKPKPESFITPVMYDQVPQIYPAGETALIPVNAAPETLTNEPSPNNEPIPVFNHYTNLPEYGKPQNNNVPPEPQVNNKNPEMYPDTNIPIFNNYPDLNKKPPNINPQIYTPAPPMNMPFTEDIPVFNSYPDLNKNPTNPQTFNKPSPKYPDYNVPVNLPKLPDYGRPQLLQSQKPIFKPKIPNLNKIYDIKIMKPNSSPLPKLLPFEIPQSEQYLLDLKKKRLSKMKHNNVRPTISMPYIGEGIENILDLSRFTDDTTYTQTHLKQNMCKLCQLLDCIHPKRQDNSLFPAIKILNEENELSEIIYKMLSKMRQFNTKYSHAPFTQEFEIMMPSVMNQNKDIFNQFKTGTDYFDQVPFMPFMFPLEWPNSHDNEMEIFNKIKSFKDKSYKNLFDGGKIKPHMLPGVMPFIPKPFNFESGLPHFNNFMPFPSNKFPNPLSMMSSLPMSNIPMSLAEPTLSLPLPIPSITNIIGDKINTPLPDLNSIPPQNFNMGPDMGIVSDDPMEHEDSAHVDKVQEANPDNFIESDFLNYTWQKPNAQAQGLGDPTGFNTQPESGQDGSLIPFDYFKSQNDVNATSSSQISSTNADMATSDGNVAADPKVVNAQRIRSKRLKRIRTNDGDLTYARKSKGC